MENLSIDNYILKRVLDKRLTSLHPFRTIFKEISRVPPGSIISYEDQIKYEPYLTNIKTPFSVSLEKSIDPLKNLDQITVMFGGGVDSTALYLALQDITLESNTDIRVVSIDIGPGTNSVEHAQSIGDKIGVEIEVLDHSWPPITSSVISEVGEKMKKDFTNPFNLPYAFINSDIEGYALSGQNFDAMLTIDMLRPQMGFSSYLHSLSQIKHLLRMMTKNFFYTSNFQNSDILRRLFCNLLRPILPDKFTLDSSSKGYLSGFISSGFPCIIQKEDYFQTKLISQLYSISKTTSFEFVVDMLNYYTYMHNSNKVITTQKFGDTQVLLPSMWAPFASRHLGRQKLLNDWLNPKYEIYDYVLEKSGFNYLKETYSSAVEYQRVKQKEHYFQNNMTDHIIPTYINTIHSTKLLDLLPDKMYDHVNNKIELVNQISAGETVTREDLYHSYRLLNIILLLED